MMKGVLVLLLLAGAVSAPAEGTHVQVPSPLSVGVAPAFVLPVGDSSRWFSYGGGVDLGLDYQPPRSLFLLTGGVEYLYAPTRADRSASLAGLRAGAGVHFPLVRGISVLGYGMGGYYFAAYNDFSRSGSNPYLAAGMALRFTLAPMFRLEAGAQYTWYLGLYQGLSARLGVNVPLGDLGGSVDMPRLDLKPAFTAFYTRYADQPVGTLQLKSTLKVPATDIRAQVFVKEYMDAPRVVDVPGVMKPGETRSVELYALFADRVLAVTGEAKAATEILVSYKVEGQACENKRVETLTLWGRNAMTWDDTRKAAAYVTAQDPAVRDFARTVTSAVRSGEPRCICRNLQAAIALHEALSLYGMKYAADPSSPYADVSRRKEAVDFLQFPRETFRSSEGDCSDLSILYASMLQAVGIDAAFITVPGRIFVAVDTGLTPEEAPGEFIPETQSIAYKGRAWVPVEVTSLRDGFCKAWEAGAREWNESYAGGDAGFYPVAEAWTMYPPVKLPDAGIAVTVPPTERILPAYAAEVHTYLDEALSEQIAKLRSQIQASRNARAMNGLGVLYARYGQPDTAEVMFKQVLTTWAFLPALLNLGNLYYRQGNWTNALASYERASVMDPWSRAALLGMARASQQMKKYADARESYAKLKALSPELAGQYAYLEAGRPNDAGAARSEVRWETGE